MSDTDISGGSALDRQVGGSHYKSLMIQPTEYCEANKLTHCQSNIVKYISRFNTDEMVPYGVKGGLIDLEKAEHVIQMMKEIYYGKDSPDT